jgi:hypothetical protein
LDCWRKNWARKLGFWKAARVRAPAAAPLNICCWKTGREARRKLAVEAIVTVGMVLRRRYFGSSGPRERSGVIVGEPV